ncbi:hypothetical protein CK203_010344 [Vitis vinifera]|uniref:Uncharacterized protein n=1 Tax=Vitis vinifera TaxID=29760 RepID=A0A438ENZ2_VITVI|nr:hypothetical protein CK203_080263 [Vitis vinifera]RVX13726.1 hypothetical protein CK203_010344 [Vitis vinifera]
MIYKEEGTLLPKSNLSFFLIVWTDKSNFIYALSHRIGIMHNNELNCNLSDQGIEEGPTKPEVAIAAEEDTVGRRMPWDAYWEFVQHLIEKCLIFHMSKEECMEALSKHADINQVITSTVWNELEKENKEFFEAYHTQTQTRDDRMSEAETNEMIQKMIADSKDSD